MSTAYEAPSPPASGFAAAQHPSVASPPTAAEVHRFRQDIQGLRALAVGPVVLFHAFPKLLPGGFVGVDIFFVISGYLITRILHQEIADGRFSLTSFYVRRVKRLFPALYLMLATTLIAGLLLLPPAALDEMAKTLVATIGFASNLQFYRVSGYFDGAAELKPLLHTWSLAVEEQFYLLFPLALVTVARWAPRRLGTILWGGAAASLAACLWWMTWDPSGAFYFPFTRAYELLAGSIAAVAAYPRLRDGRVGDALSLAGIALIVGAVLFLNERMAFPGWLALIPCLGTALVLVAGEARPALGGRMLSAAPLVLLGSLSYSLYLWHWPVLVFARYLALRPLTPIEASAAVLLSIALAALSWRFVERPALALRLPGWRILTAGAATMAAGVALAGPVVLTDGVGARFDPAARALLAAQHDISPRRADCHSSEWDPIPYARSCALGDPKAVPRVAVWADSFGAEYAVALGERLAARRGSVLEVTNSGCPPSLDFAAPDRDRCVAQNRELLRQIVADRRIDTVILIANYLGYREASLTNEAPLVAGIGAATRALRGAGKQVVIVGVIPRMPFETPAALGLLRQRAADPASFGPARAGFDAASASTTTALRGIATQTGARFIDPAAYLCDVTRCHGFDPQAGALYFDHAHLSLAGARKLIAGAPPVARR